MKNARSQTTFSIALLLTAPLALSACGLPPTSSDETTAASSTSATTESTSSTETTISSPSLANKAFLELPESIAGVPRQSQEVDNPNNTAIIFYADETQEFRVRAILGDPPIVGEDQAEVREGFIDNYLTEMNLSFPTRSISAHNFTFQCSEGTDPTQSDTHKGICATTFGDRIVEFQFFSSAHDGDPEQRTEEIAKGLAEALNSLQA
ncbi:hypothetical protein [Corynebacterium sp.]|uniref:hypothetical protein n=1 Tax=Corynebacterium sp. TaxID=1720 RepID=UPI0026DD9EDB|nr:hypothetical protein [Corynebacterium sp.]MDO5077911.1 hypothetical protein [Corynebacterium sp.]